MTPRILSLATAKAELSSTEWWGEGGVLRGNNELVPVVCFWSYPQLSWTHLELRREAQAGDGKTSACGGFLKPWDWMSSGTRENWEARCEAASKGDWAASEVRDPGEYGVLEPGYNQV